MPTYISLLRGINVGGHKKIKMADLRQLYASLELANVKSYVQSGNVVFDTPHTNRAAIATQIESAIESAYGFHVPVLLRVADELQKLIEQNPLLELTNRDGKNHYVLFLDRSSTAAEFAQLDEPTVGQEQFSLLDDALFVYYPKGAGRSKLSTNYFERKLHIAGTMRNWRTLNKLFALATDR